MNSSDMERHSSPIKQLHPNSILQKTVNIFKTISLVLICVSCSTCAQAPKLLSSDTQALFGGWKKWSRKRKRENCNQSRIAWSCQQRSMEMQRPHMQKRVFCCFTINRHFLLTLFFLWPFLFPSAACGGGRWQEIAMVVEKLRKTEN